MIIGELWVGKGTVIDSFILGKVLEAKYGVASIREA